MKNNKIILFISVLCFLIMSVSFTVMAVDKTSVISGLMFWIPLIGGVVTQFILAGNYKRLAPYDVKTKRIGIISFCSNKLATAADIFAAVSLIAFVISISVSKTSGEFINFVLLSVFVFLLCMHCILNGRIYYGIMKSGSNKNGRGK